MSPLIEALRRREVQMIGAAISQRDWRGVEIAYNQLRDKMDEALRPPPMVAARSGIEAQHGLNDVFPGDMVPAARAQTPSGDL